MARTLAVAVIGIWIGLLWGTVSPVRADGPYRGRVIDAETRAPIAGAVVVGIWERTIFTVHSPSVFEDARETVTDADGWFELLGAVVGPVGMTYFGIQLPRLFVFAPGYAYYPSYAADPLPGLDRAGRLQDLKRRGQIALRRYRSGEEQRQVMSTASALLGEAELDSDLESFRALINAEHQTAGLPIRDWERQRQTLRNECRESKEWRGICAHLGAEGGKPE